MLGRKRIWGDLGGQGAYMFRVESLALWSLDQERLSMDVPASVGWSAVNGSLINNECWAGSVYGGQGSYMFRVEQVWEPRTMEPRSRTAECGCPVPITGRGRRPQTSGQLLHSIILMKVSSVSSIRLKTHGSCRRSFLECTTDKRNIRPASCCLVEHEYWTVWTTQTPGIQLHPKIKTVQ